MLLFTAIRLPATGKFHSKLHRSIRPGRTGERNDTMRLKLLCAGIVGLAATALPQTSAAPELHLRGGRFQPLVYEQMDAEQKVMTDDVLKGERGSMNGPYNVL